MKKILNVLTLLLVLIFCLSSVSVIASAEETTAAAVDEVTMMAEKELMGTNPVETEPTDTKPQEPEFQNPTKGESRVAYLSGRRYLGVLVDVDIKDDNTITYRDDSIHWTNNSLTYLYQWTVPGNGMRFSYFVGYMNPVTATELIIGDITHWIKDSYKDDLETLTVYSAVDPNGAWTKVETTNVRYNCDIELSGSYKFGGIRLLFDAPVTANYFMIVDTDNQSRRLWLSGNTMAAVRQGDVPEETLPAADTTVADTTVVDETTAVDTTVFEGTTEVDETSALDITTEIGESEKDNDTVWYVIMGIEALVIVVLVALLIAKKKKN